VMICMSTDYDAWRDSEEGVNVSEVMNTMVENSANAKRFLATLIERVDEGLVAKSLASVNALEGSMRFAVCTQKEARNADIVEKINYILPGYY
jgi:5'-methylthioadenosine phosphorylase